MACKCKDCGKTFKSERAFESAAHACIAAASKMSDAELMAAYLKSQEKK